MHLMPTENLRFIIMNSIKFYLMEMWIFKIENTKNYEYVSKYKTLFRIFSRILRVTTQIKIYTMYFVVYNKMCYETYNKTAYKEKK